MRLYISRLVVVLCSIVAISGMAFDALSKARNQTGVAVIIGNKNYKSDRVPAVEYAHRDAEAFKRYVTDVLGFAMENIIDLRDASYADFLGAFGNHVSPEGRVWRYIDPSGTSDVVVYYSGHGVPGQKDKRGYLLPVDADPNAPEISGYSIDQLYDNLGKLVDAHSVSVYLDACFSGESHSGMLIKSASPVYVKAILPKANARLTILTAASGAQLASWDEKAKHGLFTNNLLDALYGKADKDGNAQVTAKEVKTYLDRNMTRQARRTYGREQVANLKGSGGIVLANLSGGGIFERPNPGEIDSGTGPGAKQGTTASTSTASDTPTYQTFVATTNLNVRAQPSNTGAKIGQLPRDTVTWVTGMIPGTEWLAIPYNGGSAYVSGKYMHPVSQQEIAAFEQAKSSLNSELSIRQFMRTYPNSYYTKRILEAVAGQKRAEEQRQAKLRAQQYQATARNARRQEENREATLRADVRRAREQEEEKGQEVFAKFLGAVVGGVIGVRGR
ncbi:MAG: SH3 domain-containing protein [Rhodospirillaceae bacterium]|jgi:uncharacterized protein YraI|nr:SH3 domain-containing protein [Rhodospirillaceae bacterium]MBT4699864.1 SH3 domain-containing protein [Rhodospirillaceae bacterium]